MFLHIGSNQNVRTSEILGIFDMDTATVAPQTKRFLSRAQRDGGIVNVSDDLPKSFVVAAEPLRAFREISPAAGISPAGGDRKGNSPRMGSRPRGLERVYLSQLATQTLAQRSEQ